MFMIEYKKIGWWYWLITAGLLTYGVVGNTIGFILAIGLTIFQLIHFIFREKNITAFPVQVRYWQWLPLLRSVTMTGCSQWLAGRDGMAFRRLVH